MSYTDDSLFAISLRVVKKAPRRALTSPSRWKRVEDTLRSLPIDAKIPSEKIFRRFLVEEVRKTGHLRDTYVPLFFWDTTVNELVLSEAQLETKYICELIERCTCVTSLKLSNCYKVDDACIEVVLGRTGSALRELSLEGCRRISDKTLGTLGEKGVALERIDLGGCFNLTVEGVRNFLTRFPNPERVRYLGLAGLPVEADVLIDLANRFSSLDSLSLGYYRGTDPPLVAFLHKMRRLRVLRVHYSDWITDAVVDAVASYCPKIESVDLKGCVKVTHTAIHDILARCSTVIDGVKDLPPPDFDESQTDAMDVVEREGDTATKIGERGDSDGESSLLATSSRVDARPSERRLRKIRVGYTRTEKPVLDYYRAAFPSVEIVE